MGKNMHIENNIILFIIPIPQFKKIHWGEKNYVLYGIIMPNIKVINQWC
jgi:hypothetical protein